MVIWDDFVVLSDFQPFVGRKHPKKKHCILNIFGACVISGSYLAYLSRSDKKLRTAPSYSIQSIGHMYVERITYSWFVDPNLPQIKTERIW